MKDFKPKSISSIHGFDSILTPSVEKEVAEYEMERDRERSIRLMKSPIYYGSGVKVRYRTRRATHYDMHTDRLSESTEVVREVYTPGRWEED